jgi:uncharacterized repeat protein (TIGR01451 family)
MAKKRFFLILGVLLLALLMVRATLAAASSARLSVLPDRTATLASRQSQAGSEFRASQLEVAAYKSATISSSTAQEAEKSAIPKTGDAPSRPKDLHPLDLDFRRDSSAPDLLTGGPNALVRGVSPSFPTGSSAFDTEFLFAPMVISEAGQLSMWYSGIDRLGDIRVGLATSSDGIAWSKSGSNPLLDGMEVFILKEGASDYKAWFASQDAQIFRAKSTDGSSWTLDPATPVLSPTGQTGDWDCDYVSDPSVVKDADNIYWMFYEGENYATEIAQIGVATSTNGIDWQRVSSSPVIVPGGSGAWDEAMTLDPIVLLDGGEFRMWYSALNSGWTARSIGYVTSTNGVDWNKYGSNPVFEGDPGGWDSERVAAPFVLEDDGYHMWYQSHGAIGYVTSTNGLDWPRTLDHPVLRPTPAMFVDVNSFYDSIEARATPEADITITVVLSGGERYTMTGQVDGDGAFRSWEQEDQGNNWVPERPDIEAGDAVTVTADGSVAVINPVGEIRLDELDLDNDTISGTLHAPWFTSPSTLTVRCEVWVEGGPAVVVNGVEADGGSFSCDFSGDWDLQVGQNVAVMYYEPDLDLVQDVFRAPWMRVNYAHDWVGGDYEAGHTVWITVADGGGETKAATQVETGPWGGWGADGFETDWENWDPEGPDIDFGDLVTITTDDGFNRTIRVGEIRLDKIDADADTISGTIHPYWFDPLTLTVQCEVWESDGPPPVQVEGVEADGGNFTCDFRNVSWDLLPGQHVAVFYYEPDTADIVINVFEAPWMRVNYAHDWVGGDYPAGHTMAITVTYGGALRASAEVETQQWGGWDGDGFETDYEDDWQPSEPDIQEGDLVTFASDDGYFNVIQVGEIRLDELDLDEDTVSGTIHAPWFTNPSTLRVRCAVWVEDNPEPIELENVAADGGSFLCDFSGEYDLRPGMDVAVMYFEPDDNDAVINVFHGPAPDVRIEKWAEGSGEAMVDGPVVFGLRVINQGDATASSILVTDTLPEFSDYLTDSSGVAANLASGQVAWTLGPLAEGEELLFQLVLSHSADPNDGLVNHVEAFVEDDSNPDNNSAEAEVRIIEEAPDLYVDKNPNPGDPAAGETFLYEINYGNQGEAASGPARITETLPLSTSVVSWFSDNGYKLWKEVVNDGEKLVLEAASIPGYWGERLFLRLELDAGVPGGTQLTNTVSISTSLDADGGNNWAQNTDAWVSDPRWDTGAYKDLGYGKLTAGGWAGYNIQVRNHGNMASQTWLTDTLPEGFSADEVKATAWMEGESKPFPPDHVNGRTLVWDLGVMEPAQWVNFNLEVRIPIDLAAGEVFTNCVEVETAEVDGYPYNDGDCVVESVHTPGPNLRLRKGYQWNWKDQLEYWIGFLNLGTTTFENLDITDMLPVSTTYNGNWWHDFWREVWFKNDAPEGPLVWRLEELQPGWSSSIHFQVDLDGDIVDQTGLAFTNTVSSPIAGDVDTGDNLAQAVAYSGPDLFVVKRLSGGELRPGELITYTIRFGNQNLWPWHTEEGYTCTLTDVLPSQVTFVTATAPWDPSQTWTPDIQAGNTLVWTWDRAWADSWWEFEVVAQVKNSVKAGETLTNHVEMYSNSPDDMEWDWSNNVFDLLESIFKVDIYLPLVMR